MAAYASLVSLLNIIDNIENHPRLSISLDKKQTESLCRKIDLLLEFIETDSHGVTSKEAQEVLESEIASAAYAGEDVIESHIVDQIHHAADPISLLDLQMVIQEMDSVKEKVVNAKEKRGCRPTYLSSATTSSKPLTGTGKSRMVGFEDELIQLMDALTGHQSALQIITIVGMGGIGKTTLARNTYENSLISQHFDIRAWATVSQEYSLKIIFSKLLSCLSKYPDGGELDRENETQLADRLYKSLVGRRYLIVLDDTWSIEAWHAIKRFFPDNNNRSRIVITSRLSNMATHLGTSSSFTLRFLDEDKSWKLFCEKAFAEGGCPLELEEIGKKIAAKCKGLPLLISVIGGLLSKYSNQRKEYWEDISENINTILNSGEEEEQEQSLDILSLSYNHLDARLKPCFLYMGIYPEDYEIDASRLVKIWVAEGFIRPDKTRSLEEVAECYLKDLVDRNLILVRTLGSNGRMQTCYIHDLLRDLCLKIAHEEKFLCVMIKPHDLEQLDVAGNERRLVVFLRDINHALKASPVTRSFVRTGFMQPVKFKLLRVLNVLYKGHCFLDNILELVNLRYVEGIVMDSRISGELLSSISLLWNLQTLVIDIAGKFVAPPEIWEMTQLRHVDISKVSLPDPPPSQDHEFVILRNLQTLKTVLNLRLSEEVCKRIPNVKELGTIYDELDLFDKYSSSCDFGRLQKLESLTCQFSEKPELIAFPSSLRELSLTGWYDMAMIGSLPHLQSLDLELFHVEGEEWNVVEGEFLSLKVLKISWWADLKYWNVVADDKSCFPVLENLVLDSLLSLEEIPSGIGEIATLGVIDVIGCSVSAAVSAVKILEEQESLGNEGVHVRVRFYKEHQLNKFRDKAQEFESFKSNNLQVNEACLIRNQVIGNKLSSFVSFFQI